MNNVKKNCTFLKGWLPLINNDNTDDNDSVANGDDDDEDDCDPVT